MNQIPCRLCGKQDKKVNLYAGGLVDFAHQECLEIASKGIEAFLRQQLFRFDSETKLPHKQKVEVCP